MRQDPRELQGRAVMEHLEPRLLLDGDFTYMGVSIGPGYPPPLLDVPLSAAPVDPDSATFVPHYELVPDYDWWYGCTPTTGGMQAAWWDYELGAGNPNVSVFPGDPLNYQWGEYGATASVIFDVPDHANGVVNGWPHIYDGDTWEEHIPDSIGGAFVFRFENMRPALQLSYEDDSIDVVRIVTLDRIRAGASAGWQAVYLDIGAMGGNIYAPEAEADEREQPIRWQELNQLGILGKNFRYIDSWQRYESSPFLAYYDGGLKPLPAAELKKVADNLYSLR